ncbi:MAG: YciI family protein [Alsobacter sp.]
MKFCLLMHETQNLFAERGSARNQNPYWSAWNAYIGAIHQAGIVESGSGLEPPTTATTVRVKDGVRQVQDGPFADTKEQLGGFFIINVPDLETALEWAARSPAATGGSVEVRPILVME